MDEIFSIIPKPPHDPTSLLLNAKAGWQEAKVEKLILSNASGHLTLAAAREGMRSLAEASGSFGGLVLPTGMAIAETGDLYLLDPQRLELKRFDPYECVFISQPCFGEPGRGPRQLSDPHGIGICAGILYVCDTGNQRVGLFTLRGFVLLGHWRPPQRKSWEPYDVEFDRRGQVYISDPLNGVVHLFSQRGRWLGEWTGVPGASHLARDGSDRIYVVASAVGSEVRQLNEAWQNEAVPDFTAKLTSGFSPLPFRIDREGNLNLKPLCVCICEDADTTSNEEFECCWFTLSGQPFERRKNKSPEPLFETSGCYVSRELDSQLYRCQWHRVILHGELVEGTRIVVSTFTSEVVLRPDEIPPDAWQTYPSATKPKKETDVWDCLVRSNPGRYLWLRLQLVGNGLITPRLERVEIEFPRISLRRYLPAVFGEEPVSADFTDRFLSLFDTTMRGIEGKLDRLAGYFDPLSAPADPRKKQDFLSWLGTWVGISMDRHWPEDKRRRFLKEAARLFDLRGTRFGLWRQLVVFLEMQRGEECCTGSPPRSTCQPRLRNCAPEERHPCEWQPPPLILEHYQLRRWLYLGAGRLGEQSELWGKRIVNRSQLGNDAQIGETQLLTTQDPYRDPFHVYAHKFTLFVPSRYRTDQHRKSLENLLKSESPAHTQFHLEFVEPRFRIGVQAMIGYDAVIGKYPRGVTLDETSLSEGPILTSKQGTVAGPAPEIGPTARIGTTRILGTLDQGPDSGERSAQEKKSVHRADESGTGSRGSRRIL